MKISIAMSYHNRKDLLLTTLKTLSYYKEDIHEVVIVDDASSPEHKIDFINDFDFKIKLIEIPENLSSKYVNCCVPFNLALRACEGDAVIIQNPETYHVGNVLGHVKNNLSNGKYLSFPVYAFSQENTSLVPDPNTLAEAEFVKYNRDFVTECPQVDGSYTNVTPNGWYNHPDHRPADYHFTTAIMRKDLEELNYFDERLAPCVAFDDNDLITRIKRKGMEVQRVDIGASLQSGGIKEGPFTIHQWHTQSDWWGKVPSPELIKSTLGDVEPTEGMRCLFGLCACVFEKIIQKETSHKAEGKGFQELLTEENGVSTTVNIKAGNDQGNNPNLEHDQTLEMLAEWVESDMGK